MIRSQRRERLCNAFKATVFLAVWLALVQASCDWDSQGAKSKWPLWCPHLKSSRSELCAVQSLDHLGRKQPLERALICRNMKASYLSPIPFIENAWMKAAVGAGWRLRINNDITWRGVCQHSDTSFRLPLSDYPNSNPPMTGMITGRREEHNCQAWAVKPIPTISAPSNQILDKKKQESSRECERKGGGGGEGQGESEGKGHTDSLQGIQTKRLW